MKKYLQFPVPFLNAFPRVWLLAFVVLVVADLSSKVWITRTLNFDLAPYQRFQHNLGPEHKAVLRYSGPESLERADGTDKIDILGENGRYVNLHLVFNDRFVFGSGPAAPVLGFFLTLGAVIFLFFYRWHNYNAGLSVAWLFVFSGALGNLIDKMFVKSLIDRSWKFSIVPQPDHVSGVVDFVECIWFGYTPAASWCVPGTSFCPLAWLAWPVWPIWNLADSLIVVGMILLLFTMKQPPVAKKG